VKGRAYGSAAARSSAAVDIERFPARLGARTCIDFDGSFEIGSILNHHASCGDVALERSLFLDLDAFFCSHISFDFPPDHNFSGDNVRVKFSLKLLFA
jgi:hypothetical protein